MADDGIEPVGASGGVTESAPAPQAPPPQEAASPQSANDAQQASRPAEINTNDHADLSKEAHGSKDAHGAHGAGGHDSVTKGIASWARPESAKVGESASRHDAGKASGGEASAKHESLKHDLHRGAGIGKKGASDEVKSLQDRLSRAGLDPGGVDGKFGKNTQHAVSEFQKKNGLPVSGVADAKTREALEKIGGDPSAAKGTTEAKDAAKAGTDGKAASDPKAAGECTEKDAKKAAEKESNTPLSEKDKKTAEFLSKYLKKHGHESLPGDIGEMIVRAGKKHNVDPLAVAAIPGNETHWGKTGIGVKGMAGVGAYDKDPRNAVRNPTFSGVDKQIEGAAKTFDRLRTRAGRGSEDPMRAQMQGVGKRYASDKGWAGKVYSIYKRLSKAMESNGD